MLQNLAFPSPSGMIEAANAAAWVGVRTSAATSHTWDRASKGDTMIGLLKIDVKSPLMS